MRALKWIGPTLAALALPWPAPAQPIDEQLFRLQYGHAVLAAPCGHVDAAEGARLTAAIAAYYAARPDLRIPTPRIAPNRLAALRAEMDRARPAPGDCARIARYVAHLRAEYPPGGRLDRNQPGTAGWDAIVSLMTRVRIAERAQACRVVSAATSRAVVERALAVPLLRFHLTPAEIAETLASARAPKMGRQIDCGRVRDMLELIQEEIAADEAGWQPAN